MQLLIATRNAGKVVELRHALADQPFELVSLDDAGVPKDFDVEETGSTFEENAILKAQAYGDKTGMLTLAEDAGLEVDTLDGRPGVYSARYAPGTDKDRYLKLLDELKDVPDTERGAQFRAVIALYDPASGKLRTCEGKYRGEITREPKGENGFGYDPVFYYAPKGKMTAEMTPEEKLEVSHRGIAVRLASEILSTEFI